MTNPVSQPFLVIQCFDPVSGSIVHNMQEAYSKLTQEAYSKEQYTFGAALHMPIEQLLFHMDSLSALAP